MWKKCCECFPNVRNYLMGVKIKAQQKKKVRSPCDRQPPWSALRTCSWPEAEEEHTDGYSWPTHEQGSRLEVPIWTQVTTWSLSQFWSASVDRSSSESVCFLYTSRKEGSSFCSTWVRYRATSWTTAFLLQRKENGLGSSCKWIRRRPPIRRCTCGRTSGWWNLRRTCGWNRC